MVHAYTLTIPSFVLFNKPEWDEAVERAMDMTAEDIRIDFQVTTQTWKGKPLFKIVNKGDAERWIGTDSDIYRFVNSGTAIRYATMTPDFSAKTTPGHIGSVQGKGGVAFISKKHPRPGIKARDFDKVIGDKWTKRFPQLLQRSINVQARKIKSRSP